MELRPTCEHCNTALPNDSTEAMICSYDCTFCKTCVDTILENVCPNCGGGFTQRPTRPKSGLARNPMSSTVIHKPIDFSKFDALKAKNKTIPPHLR